MHAPPDHAPADAYDALVVGGSWAGLSAAMQLARARRRVLVVDAETPRNRFAAAHGFLGQDGRAPAAILETARTQVLAYPTAALRVAEATHARPIDDGFRVELSTGATVRAHRLVLASGVVDELADVAGLRERWGSTVLHCPYCHGYEVADRALGELAAGELAMHQALLLLDWSATVTLFTNGTFTPDAAQHAMLDERGVRLETRPVDALVGDAPSLAGIRLGDGAVVPLDALFTTSRTRLASTLAEQLGCTIDHGPFGPIVRTDARKETSVPGVFAAGDAARVPHNASFASADGVMAGVSAHQSLALADPPVPRWR